MVRNHVLLSGLAAAILIIGGLAFGLPLSSLLLAAVVVACPVMMMFMMVGMHAGRGHGHESRDAEDVPGDRGGKGGELVDRPPEPDRTT